jgi:NAD(P)H dehydrogenase (quinone)
LTILTNLVKFNVIRVLEILCNPRPGSYGLALAASAREALNALGHEVLFHDLYREGFDPVLGAPELARSFSLDGLVQVHCEELTAAEGLLIVHPDWWGQPSAMLKGWVDRVFRQGIAYELSGEDGTEKTWAPLLADKKGLVFCTSDEPDNAVPRTLETLWTDVILGRCGMEAACHVLRNMRRGDPAARRAWLDFALATLRTWFPARTGRSYR